MIARQQNQRHHKPDVPLLPIGQSSGHNSAIVRQGNGGGGSSLSQGSTTEQSSEIDSKVILVGHEIVKLL